VKVAPGNSMSFNELLRLRYFWYLTPLLQGSRNCIWVWWSYWKKCQSSLIFYLVSVLSKICTNFSGHVWQDWQISWTLLLAIFRQ